MSLELTPSQSLLFGIQSPLIQVASCIEHAVGGRSYIGLPGKRKQISHYFKYILYSFPIFALESKEKLFLFLVVVVIKINYQKTEIHLH